MPGKNPAMTPTEMVDAGRQRKQSKLYRQETAEFSDRQISALVSRAAGELERTPQRVSLTDIGAVKRITATYLSSCEASSTVPSISGLARALGLTRSAIYDCIHRQSPREASEWFELCHDTFADLLSQASLRGSVQPVTSIFVLKAAFGWREGVEIIAKKEDCGGPLGPVPDPEELDRRIAGLTTNN